MVESVGPSTIKANDLRVASVSRMSAPTPAAEEPGAEPSIAALLARLERGAAGMKQG